MQKRFVPMGGGMKPQQLQWLRKAFYEGFVLRFMFWNVIAENKNLISFDNFVDYAALLRSLKMQQQRATERLCLHPVTRFGGFKRTKISKVLSHINVSTCQDVPTSHRIM